MKLAKSKKGISLIVLVITILVMIILASSVILVLTENGMLVTANKATLQSDLKNFQEQLELYKSSKLVNNREFDETSLFAFSDSLKYNTITDEEKGSGNIYTILPDAVKYGDRVRIESGELIFEAKGKEIEWCSSIGVRVSGFYIVDGVLLSVNGVENLIDNTGTLVLPNTVKEISAGAFYKSTALKNLIIPGTVEKINAGAFKGNTSLETVEMRDGVKQISDTAFQNCTSLKKVIMPDSITSIGSGTFQNCISLEYVKLSKNIKEIKEHVFIGCKKLTTVDIPENVSVIRNAFANCYGLTNLRISKNVTKIYANAFSNCNKLSLTIDEENTTYKMVDNFLCSKDGKNVLEVLGAGQMTELTIPEGVETISIKECNRLVKLIVPASVKDLGNFYGTSRLSEVVISDDNNYYSADENAIYNKDKTILVRCLYNGNKYTVDEGVKNLASNSFHDKSNLKELILPESLETVSDLAIYSCSKLETLYIGESLKNVHGRCLYNLPALTNVIINPKNSTFTVKNNMILSDNEKTLVRTFGNAESIEIPGTITKIGKAAFSRQDSIKNIVFNEGLISLEDLVFASCQYLTKVELPSTLTKISSGAFRDSSNLSEIIINKPKDSISGSPWLSPYGTKAIIWAG